MPKMKYHPLSAFFPMLAPADFDDLVEDIRAKGQLEPIVIYDGKVLDGRNRYEACEMLGIKVKSRELPKGVKPLDYVISANLKRRQLTDGQKVGIMRRIYPNEGKGQPPKSNVPTGTLTRVQIAQAAGVSENTVQRFDSAASHADLRDKMAAGEMTPRQAEREYTRRKAARQASPSDAWRWTPSVVHIVDWLKNYEAKLRTFQEADALGKLSPEAGRFIAKRIREVCASYLRWADALEKKHHV
jgi:hypothetical protein